MAANNINATVRFYTRSQNCEKGLLVASCPSVNPSVRMEQLGSQWFYETWHMSFFRKSVEKIQVSLKSGKNNEYFTWRRFHIYENISLNSFQNKKCSLTKAVEEIKTTYFMFNNFFRKSHRLWDNVEKYGWPQGPQMTLQYSAKQVACWINKATFTHANAYVHEPAHTHARTHTHTHTNM
jgi:hypothetical protein